MKLADPVAAQLLDLLDRDRGGDQAAGLRIVIESIEALAQPRRDARAAGTREAQYLRKARDGQDPRHERRVEAECGATITKAQKHPDVVEELRDGARRTRVDLALEIVQVRRRGTGLRVNLGVGGHG